MLSNAEQSMLICPECGAMGKAYVHYPKTTDGYVVFKFDSECANIDTYQTNKTFRLAANCKTCGSPMIIVDNNIAKLILSINKLGYRTEECCSGHDNEKKLRDVCAPYLTFRPSKYAETVYETAMKLATTPRYANIIRVRLLPNLTIEGTPVPDAPEHKVMIDIPIEYIMRNRRYHANELDAEIIFKQFLSRLIDNLDDLNDLWII